MEGHGISYPTWKTQWKIKVLPKICVFWRRAVKNLLPNFGKLRRQHIMHTGRASSGDPGQLPGLSRGNSTGIWEYPEITWGDQCENSKLAYFLRSLPRLYFMSSSALIMQVANCHMRTLGEVFVSLYRGMWSCKAVLAVPEDYFSFKLSTLQLVTRSRDFLDATFILKNGYRCCAHGDVGNLE